MFEKIISKEIHSKPIKNRFLFALSKLFSLALITRHFPMLFHPRVRHKEYDDRRATLTSALLHRLRGVTRITRVQISWKGGGASCREMRKRRAGGNDSGSSVMSRYN